MIKAHTIAYVLKETYRLYHAPDSEVLMTLSTALRWSRSGAYVAVIGGSVLLTSSNSERAKGL